MKLLNRRLRLVDGLRGLTIVSMVIYHLLYDLYIIYGLDPDWAAHTGVRLWQQSICWVFIFISGFVWRYGRGNIKRGLFLNLLGMVISLVTCLIIPSDAVWFGILSFLGCAILLAEFFRKPLGKIPPWLGLGLCFALFLALKNVPIGYVGYKWFFSAPLPGGLYTSWLLVPLGFPFPGFRSSDYFPMIPWLFLFFSGYFSNRLFSENPGLVSFAQRPLPFFESIGRKSLLIYVLHQPGCILLCVIFLGLPL